MKVKRIGAQIAFLLCLAAASLPAMARGQIQLAQPDASRFPDVRLFVYPTGPGGAPMLGLRQAQFEVFEDGRPAEVREFRDAAAGTPIEVCLAIDRSGSMADEAKLAQAQEAAVRFVASMREGDRAALISFASGATLDQTLSGDRMLLRAAIARLRAGGGTALYDGLYWAVEQVSLRGRLTTAATAGARRVVLALTDGNDNESHAREADVIRQARANGVTVYTIGLGSDVSRALLQRLASATGGQFYHAPRGSDLDLLYARIARQLKSEYAITFRTPRPTADGTRRAVEVRLLEAGEIPAATGWYQAPGAGSLVVTVTAGSQENGLATAAPGTRPGLLPLLFLGGALLVAAGVTLFFLLLARRQRGSRSDAPARLERWSSPAVQRRGRWPSPPLPGGRTAAVPGAVGRATNPRLDLMPLWVRGSVTRIGRAEENELVVDSPLVSRRHARIERDGASFRVVDHGSTHGTFVNGRRVEEAPLQVGDVIRFADREFRFGGEAE